MSEIRTKLHGRRMDQEEKEEDPLENPHGQLSPPDKIFSAGKRHIAGGGVDDHQPPFHSLPPGHSRTGNIFVCRENVLVPVIKRDRCRISRFTVLHETEIGISNKLLPRFPPLRFFFFFFPPPRFSLAGLQAGAEFPRNNLDRAKGSGIKIHKARVSRPFHDYTPFKREAGFRTTTHGGADDGTKISRSGKSLLIHFENGIQRRDRFLHAYHVEAIRWKSVLFRRDRFSFFSFPRGQSRSRACIRPIGSNSPHSFSPSVWIND